MIPARYASTRLPAKPLLSETGKPLIQHVVEAVRPAERADRIVVATDDARIEAVVRDFGGEVVMTRADHATGTDRLAEAAALLDLAERDIVVNVQGDEPDMPPELVDLLVTLLEETEAPMATLCTPLPAEQADNPNKVKVVFNARREAMYFSRAAIPFDRDQTGVQHHLHLGIYAYRVGFLRQYAALPSPPCEAGERLEQLRALEHGHRIAIATVRYSGGGIDTPEDYAAFVQRLRHA